VTDVRFILVAMSLAHRNKCLEQKFFPTLSQDCAEIALFPIAQWPMEVVLLVEDDDPVRVVVESYLEELGHKVVSAGTP
jgi:hypothetical protein